MRRIVDQIIKDEVEPYPLNTDLVRELLLELFNRMYTHPKARNQLFLANHKRAVSTHMSDEPGVMLAQRAQLVEDLRQIGDYHSDGMKEYVLLIKTDSYAGNFERELCAYITGCVGECEVGEEYVDEDITELFSGYIGSQQDDSGCWRPVSIAYDDTESLEIYFHAKPSDELLETIKKRIRTSSEVFKKFKILKAELLEVMTTRLVNVIKELSWQEDK